MTRKIKIKQKYRVGENHPKEDMEFCFEGMAQRYGFLFQGWGDWPGESQALRDQGVTLQVGHMPHGTCVKFF